MPVTARAGFGRELRLLSAAEFKPVFDSSSVRSKDRFFTVLARRNGLTRPRLGLAIAKKQVRRAVGRNRIKRLVRESFRRHQQQLRGWDIVILARQDVAAVANAQLSVSLSGHWARIANTRCDDSVTETP